MKDFVKVLLVNLIVMALLMLLLVLQYKNIRENVNLGLPFLWLSGINVIISIIRVASRKEDAKIFLLFAGILFLIGFSVCSLTLSF